MKQKPSFFETKFTPKLWTAIFYLLIIAGNLYMFYGRKKVSFRLSVLEETFDGFYTHISNFTILFLLTFVIGYIWLIIGMSFQKIIYLMIASVLINFVYELFVPILNTQDLTDAWYGLVGGVISLAFLFLISRFGLQRNPNRENKAETGVG